MVVFKEECVDYSAYVEVIARVCVVGDSHCVHGNGLIEEDIDSCIRYTPIEIERR